MSPVSRSVSRPVSRSILAGQSNILASIIKSLFANNEQGFAYDPNDLSTMFQDAAGTNPVTAVGQPVGLMLDKSKGLEIGSNLVRNGDFSDGATSWVARANTQLSIVNGRLRVSAIASGIAYGVDSTLVSATVASKMYRFSAEVYRTNTSNNVYARGASNTALVRNTSFNIIEIGGSSSSAFVASLVGVVAGEYFEIDNVSINEIVGSHAYQTASASRPILRKNAVTGANYLEFDGGDDFLQTSNIDFTATDKVSLFAGVRIPYGTYSSSFQVVAELSVNTSSNNGTFVLTTPHFDFGGAQYSSRGTTQSDNFFSGITTEQRVITAESAISSNLNSIRVNGGAYKNTAASQGTGNYGNYPLYIGRRGGTTLPFNGHLYSLIGIGRLTTDAETIALEKLIAKNTGVTLSV